ncbi:hypothetical protein Z946_1965 [Sulfitobacter noctilucicola]|uniref:Uncharacterized protein n=1 Tax=Sulfitobacter noctilucicola TaxID=1342301 RepID=A0A7W6M6H3_9RHOB|nr:hypothetical protein [Sulfitobacter noctilucicola]KIN63102.1 hypothetical protein Z946_1965 [Sulfitobacter noctilucicola]MBB4172371.1 hypothetical protein [Sulfitobacter noctilucicola]
MYRRFISTIAAASIALTALGSTSAFAGERERANALAAILGVAVVGALIHQNRKKDKRHVEVQRPAPSYAPPKHKQPVYKTPKHVKPTHKVPVYQQPKPRPLPQRVNRKLLPQQCFRTYQTRKGRVAMFAEGCLRRNFTAARHLPNQCQYVFRTPEGNRRGYEARCLRDQGYRLARG